MLQSIVTLLFLVQGILGSPHPDHHPTAVYDADDHILYLDFPPEILIANGKLCPTSQTPVTAPCNCGDSLKCNVGEVCNPKQGSSPATCTPVIMPPACEIAEPFKIQMTGTGQPCTCGGSQVCNADMVCDMTRKCVHAPPCPATTSTVATPCKCGFENRFCLGTATQCFWDRGICA